MLRGLMLISEAGIVASKREEKKRKLVCSYNKWTLTLSFCDVFHLCFTRLSLDWDVTDK